MPSPIPAVPGAKVVKALESAGFVVARITGSHHVMQHPDERTVPVPVHVPNAARRSRYVRLLIAGVALSTADSAGLLLSEHSALWLLLVISVLFGSQNGHDVVTNQTAITHRPG